MVKKNLSLALLVTGWAAVAGARNAVRIEHGLYRIDMRGHTTVFSKDAPVARGSVVLFHRHPDGLFTSVPREDVAAITPLPGGIVPARRAVQGTTPVPPSVAADTQPLAPGDLVILGATGGGSPSPAYPSVAAPGAPSPSGDIAARLAIEAQVFPGDLPAQTGSASGASYLPTNGNGAASYGGGTPGINPTLTGARPTAPATVGPNGFPITAASGPQPTGPNGFPATTTGTQSGGQTINPNGFPAMNGTSATTPQSASPMTVAPTIGAPVGTKAPAGTRGSTQSNAAATSASPAAATDGAPRTSAAPLGQPATTTAPNGQPTTNSIPPQSKPGQTAAPSSAPSAGPGGR